MALAEAVNVLISGKLPQEGWNDLVIAVNTFRGSGRIARIGRSCNGAG